MKWVKVSVMDGILACLYFTTFSPGMGSKEKRSVEFVRNGMDGWGFSAKNPIRPCHFLQTQN
jgi:hypothetical protein